MDTYKQDLELLDKFHERAYEGDSFSDEEYNAAHEAWWRVARSPNTPGNVGALVLLMYSMKYLPRTEPHGHAS